MLSSFLKYIEKENLFRTENKILLAVSGGIDSVVMCELFHLAGLKFGIAHCNFQLRDLESDQDEEFVEGLSAHYNVSFHNTTFDTASFAKENKHSIQVAARELRYTWFEKIRQEYNYHCIATAHHLNDSIETVLFNFSRGTGIAGLHGILPKQGAVVRPLLFVTKQDIEVFAKKKKLNFREDSSNASDKYTRNKIRHSIVTLLKKLNPDFERAAAGTIQRLIDTEQIYEQAVANQRAAIVKTTNNTTTISIRSLKKLNPIQAYLYEFLKPFNFNSATIDELKEALNGESGKQFFSATHRLIKDRDTLIIKELRDSKALTNSIYKLKKNQKELLTETFKLQFKKLKIYKISSASSSATIDLKKLEFPLEIRKWQKGDFFYPLGMKGKKKLSDFLTDKKFSLFEKENTWLLLSGNKIVWVIGLRMDERFKVMETTDEVLQIEFSRSQKT